MELVRVLEIVTVPFFAPRGTGFSSLERTKALSRMGHTVDILAYSLGADVEIPNVRIHRIPRLPGIREIPMGPSLRKLILDVFLALKTGWWLAFRGRWNLVHVHEEAAFWVAVMRPLYSGPVLYDMHSSLVEQLSNFGYSESGIVRRCFAFFERLALRRADGVIVICPELEDVARNKAPQVPLQLIENLPVGWDLPAPPRDEVQDLRDRYDLDGCPVILYAGTFGKNQGLELSIDAIKHLRSRIPEVRLVLVGGGGNDLAQVRAYAASQGVTDNVLFTGSQPYTTMPAFMALADVLLSPRLLGTNTPLKIYSYLASGKPIVATDLPTHTQVLSSETAELVAATWQDLAEGIHRILTDPARARALGEAGKKLAETKYGIGRYMEQLSAILDRTRSPQRGAV